MAQEQSWKDIRNQRRKENFVGRGDEVRVFTENFDAPPKYMVFAVTGEGGVGKSTLLKRFANIAASPDVDANVIICDDKQTSPVSVMGHVASELSKLGISYKEFDERYKTYQQLRQEIESDPKVPRGVVKVFSMGITDFTIKSLRKTPGVGVFLEYTDEKAAGEALGELIQYGISKWGNKDEVQLLREPEKVLTPLFLKLIQKACEKKRLVIMLDVFERTEDILSSWLLALFNFDYGEFGTKLSFVISGRDQLDQQWTDLAGMICYIRLEPFSLEETIIYLSNQGITDGQLANQIYHDTGGLPVLVELLTATKPKPGADLPDISKDAVERFLQWTPQEEKRVAALLAAVPRQFNRDILGAVLDDKADEMFNWLDGQSYIRRTSERGLFYHEKVRELMLRYILKSKPSQLTTIHSKLSEYFATSQAGLELTQEDGHKNESWCDLEIERFYHALSAYPEQSTYESLNTFLHAFRWKWRFANKVALTSQQVAIEKQSKNLQLCSATLLELYLAYERNEHELVIQKLNELETQKKLSTASQCCLFSRRGEAYRILDKYEEAIEDFNRAIELDSKYAWAIGSRGQTYQEMKKYEEALIDFNQAIEVDNEMAWVIAMRGETYRLMEKYEEALADFTRAIDLDTKYDWAIANRGFTYEIIEKYDEALTDLDRAIELNNKYTWAIVIRSMTYRNKKKYNEALADNNRALEIDEKNAWVLANRGQTYHSMGRYEDALADFTRAIELDDKSEWQFANRGLTYYSMKKYEEALADYSRAIELDQKYVWAISERGRTYYQMKKYEEALSDFTHIIELDEKYAWATAHRGQIYHSIKKYEEALADFTRAIELDEKYAWAVAQRGKTYRSMEKYEEALADFTRAIELDEKYAWAVAQRGETYRSMEKYEEALADFTRAIELDEKYGWAIASRGETYRSMNKYEEALADFTRAIELNEKYSWAFLERGLCNERLNKYEDALEDFRLALETDPDDPNDMANYSGLLLGLGKKKEGLEILDKAIQYLPAPKKPDLEVELWFYAFAHWDESKRMITVKKLKETILNGARSEGWDFSQNLRQAKEDRHPDFEWIEKLDKVITKSADVSILDDWSAWKNI